MRFDLALLMFFVAIGLVTKKLTWKGWLGLGMIVFGWIIFNWQRY